MGVPNKVIIYIDGGSRGNPGPAALGVLFLTENGKILKKYCQYIGEGTNNEAEYQALIFALKKIPFLFGKKESKFLQIEINSDSELLVKQMNGQYKIKNKKIQSLFLRAWNLKIELQKLKIFLISREKNQEADTLVNEALNNALKNKKLF